MRRICRHCEEYPVSRPKGLCYRCSKTPGVRGMYPTTSKYARRGVGRNDDAGVTLPLPTDALPGTPEKLAVLMRRAASGKRLWHPDDPTTGDGKA